MENLLLYISILLPIYTFSQPTLEFQNLTPIWKHSSEILENIDGSYNGIAPLITDTDLFLPTLLINKSAKGYLFERIDINTGDVEWVSYYYPTGLINREFPQKPFINNNNIVLPSFRENGNDNEEYIWDESRLVYRVFDFESGEVIDSLISSSGHQEIHMPWNSSFGKPSLVNNKNDIQYFDGSGSFLHTYKFNTSANVVLDTTLNPLLPVFNNSSSSYFISTTNIVILLSMNENFTKEQKIQVDIHNLDFDYQKSIDITKYILPASKHTIKYADDNHFIVESTINGSNTNNPVISNRKFYMFDYDGNLIDKFFLDWENERIGNKYYYNIYAKPNKDGDKMLVLLVNDSKNGYHTLYIKESDGNDELVTLAEFTAKYAINNFDIFQFNLTSTGNLLVTFQYIEQIEPDAEWAWSYKSVTMLISKADF